MTSWESDNIKTLLRVLYCEQFRNHPEPPPFRQANWTNWKNKMIWLQQAVQKLKERDWFWIEDEIESLTPVIQRAGLSLDRCIQVSPQGPDELLIIQSALTTRLDRQRMDKSCSIGGEDAE